MLFRELIEQLRLKRENGVVSVDDVVLEESKVLPIIVDKTEEIKENDKIINKRGKKK